MSTKLIENFADTPYKLCATATPAPNDHMELGRHSEFLGVMPTHEILMRWFINDSNDTGTWKLKGHAVTAFWDWVASWALCAESPEDLGFDGSRHVLPPLNIIRHKVVGDTRAAPGELFAGLVSATEIHDLKRQTATDRAKQAAALVSSTDTPWLIWCDIDDEGKALRAEIPEAIEIKGSLLASKKEEYIKDFTEGRARVLIGKAKALGQGMNFQHCSDMLFVGRSFSFQYFYQCLKRCHRYGQKRPVNAHILVAEGEHNIGRIVEQKGEKFKEMREHMRAAMKRAHGKVSELRIPYNPTHTTQLAEWMVP